MAKTYIKRFSPVPWHVDTTDARFPKIRDKDNEVVCAGTMAQPMGVNDAILIVRAVNQYKHVKGVD